MSHRVSLMAATCLLFVTVAVADEKKPAIGNFPFWSAPKREYADQFVPGLNAALMLTPDQITKLHEARRETIDSEAVRNATRKDPNVTDAQREEASKRSADAHADLRVRASNILTAEQRAIIDKANAAYIEVQAAVGQEFQPRFATVKGDDQARETVQKELRERVASDFARKLDGILSSDQKAVMEKAAAEERALAQNPKKK